METLAKEIYDWCVEKDLWGDSCIYFNGKAWASWDTWHDDDGKLIDNELYEYKNRNPKEYFEYANPNTLSMSFEGPLYRVLNAYVPGWIALTEEFGDIFRRHGFYYELGHAWNLSVYEI